MDAVTITSVPKEKNFDGSTLNSQPKIIIKKENIGLKEYQHQKYQYNLFTGNIKRGQFYDDLVKVKDRLEKTVPNMQQVIHMDMKRARSNQVYERKLSRDLTGPRGLNWQHKQHLQRLENDEREAERDLIRLNRDLARVSVTSLLTQRPSPHHNKDLFRSQTPRWSLSSDTNSTAPAAPLARLLRGRSFLIDPNRTTVERFTPMNQTRSSINKLYLLHEKYPWMSKPILRNNVNRHQFQLHRNSIDQEKRVIEEKLKQFLH